MAPYQPNVFISMGTPYTDRQRAFRSALLDTIRSHGMVPRMVNQTDYPSGSPLPYIRSIIADCAGIVVVAYERKLVELGTEKRRSPQEAKISNSTYTTPWNHIESAIAYCLDKPLFILCERGLRREGLIEGNYDWYVNEMDIDPVLLTDPEFTGRLTAWRDRVRAHRSQNLGTAIDFSDLKKFPFFEVARRLTMGSWIAILSAITFILSVGYFFGKVL